MEKKIGGMLSDQEKLQLTGHKTIEMYNWYANRGEYAKERAIRKKTEFLNAKRNTMNDIPIIAHVPDNLLPDISNYNYPSNTNFAPNNKPLACDSTTSISNTNYV